MSPSFERQSLESADIDLIYMKAEKVVQRSIIHEDEFAQAYGEEAVTRDLLSVMNKEEDFNKKRSPFEAEQKKVADIFEALMLEHGELSDWFGSNATTIKTGKFDDFENGVDLMVEFNNEDEGISHLGMAADVTFTSDTTKKFDRLRSQIDAGTLARVKYFKTEDGAGLDHLPEVIIGADKKTVMQLAELWTERKNKELATHKIQIMILHQIRAQLDVFAKYARSIRNEEVAKIYEERSVVINQILSQKKVIEQNVKYELMDDSVHTSIMSFLSAWNKSLTAKAA